MRFEFYRLRFHFRACERVWFPPGKSGNIVRGAFGSIFRKLACVPGCPGAVECEIRMECPYARIFEPRAAHGGGPSGLVDWPRPFVFRAAHLDGCTVIPGEGFWFDLHLFETRDPALPYFVMTFARLAREGLGPRRGRAELVSVEQLDLSDSVARRVFNGTTFLLNELPPPSAVELNDAPERAERVRVRFVTPTELKGRERVVENPEFPVLFARLRDRLSTLRALYGEGPLEIDFRGMGERAERVELTWCEWVHSDWERRSSRTGQVHPIGGFTGVAEYEGALGEFLPYLRAGCWTGVGRQTVWGKGEIRVETR